MVCFMEKVVSNTLTPFLANGKRITKVNSKMDRNGVLEYKETKKVYIEEISSKVVVQEKEGSKISRETFSMDYSKKVF